MKHKRHYVRIAAVILCICSFICRDSFSGAVKSVDEARQEQRKLENKKAETEKLLSDLEDGKDNIVSYIEKLDKKMNKLTASISEVKADISSKKEEISSLETMIAQAQENINSQYETMKKRIKYMYETKGSDYIDILFSSKSLSDFLNRNEYIEKISEYDKNMITEFINAKDELLRTKESLEQSKELLVQIKKEKKNEVSALRKLVNKKSRELSSYNDRIANAQNTIDNVDSELERQEEIINQALLEEQRRIMEEEKRRKAEEEKRRAEEEKRREEERIRNQNNANEGNKEVNTTNKPKQTEAPQTGNTGGFIWPLAVSGTITSRFGNRTSPTAGASSYHQGIDISVPAGTAIKAAKAGTVVTASYNSGAGNYVMISHGDGVFTVYMHCQSLNVSVGQNVGTGEVIAFAGSTGVSTGNHLHFGVSVNGSYTDPEKWL